MEVEEGLDTGGLRRPRCAIGPDDQLDELRARLVAGAPTCWSSTCGAGLGDARPAGGRGHLRRQDRRPTELRARLVPARPRRAPRGAPGRGLDHVPGQAAPGPSHAPSAPDGDGPGGRRRRDGAATELAASCSRRASRRWTPWPGPRRRAPARASGCDVSARPARLGPGHRPRRRPRCPVRIDHDGAYANLVLPELLAAAASTTATGRFVTELVYGTTRMRRACDFAGRPVPHRARSSRRVRTLLRLGAYQLVSPGHGPPTPRWATPSGGAAAGPRPGQRRAAQGGRQPGHAGPTTPPSLSYPDWIVDAADRRPRRRRRPGRPRRHEPRRRRSPRATTATSRTWHRSGWPPRRRRPGGAGRRPVRRPRRQGHPRWRPPGPTWWPPTSARAGPA